MASEEEIRRCIAECFGAMRNNDVEGWIKAHAEDAIVYDPVGDPPNKGHEGLRKCWDIIASYFKSWSFQEEFVHVAGHEAAVKWTFNGLAKNGKEGRIEGIDILHFDKDAKIKMAWSYWNPQSLLKTLGME